MAEVTGYFLKEAQDFQELCKELSSERSPEKIPTIVDRVSHFSAVRKDRFFHAVLNPNKPEYFEHVFGKVYRPPGGFLHSTLQHDRGVFLGKLIRAASHLGVIHMGEILETYKSHPSEYVRRSVLESAGETNPPNRNRILGHYARGFNHDLKTLARYYLSYRPKPPRG